MTKRVMLIASCIEKNVPATLLATQMWSNLLENQIDGSIEVSLGIEVGAPQSGSGGLRNWEFASIFRRFWRGPVYVYTPAVDSVITAELAPDDPKPFYSKFSYGGYVNRMLLLAGALGFDAVGRFDPGTAPPDDLGPRLQCILSMLDNSDVDVVSGVYDGRFAVRDDLVSKGRPEHYKFIHESTGIDVLEQITGGALFCQKIPGIPAIPFPPYNAGQEPTLVWASDDGFFQVMRGPKCVVLRDMKVPRFVRHGKEKRPEEYYRGLAGMVCLNALRGHPCLGLPELRAIVYDFVCRLNSQLDLLDTAERLVPSGVAPDGFLQAVMDGWVNYQALASRWSAMVETLSRHRAALEVVSSL